jgi:hypothetical protein
MRVSAAALCALFALACGSGNPAKQGVTTDAGDAAAPGPDAPDAPGSDLAAEPPAPADAAAEAAPDAGPEAAPEPHPDGRTEAPPPVVITVAGECGSPSGPRCPATYLGTSTIALQSQSVMATALAPDEAMYLGGSFSVPTDFDPTAGIDMRMPSSEDAFLTSLAATGGYGFTRTFPVTGGFEGAGIYALSAGASAVIAAGGFDGTIDLDPGPTADTHESLGARSGSFIVKLTRAGTLVWSRILDSADAGSVGWGRPALAADGSVYVSGGYSQSTQDGVVIQPVDLDPGPANRPPPNARGSFFARLDVKGDLQWLHTVGGSLEGCTYIGVDGVVTTADGAGWFVGTYDGACALDQGTPLPTVDNGVFVASFGADGKLRGLGAIAGNLSVVGVALAADGKVVFAGAVGPPEVGPPTIDLDPSPAVVRRDIPTGGATYVLALDATGKLAWAELLPDMAVQAFAPTADGGALLAGAPWGPTPALSVVRLGADHKELWRFLTGSSTTYPTALLVGAKGFTLVGNVGTTGGDLDPSAGVDRITGAKTFLSRYAF